MYTEFVVLRFRLSLERLGCSWGALLKKPRPPPRRPATPRRCLRLAPCRCPSHRSASGPAAGVFGEHKYLADPGTVLAGTVRTKVDFDATGGGNREKGLNFKATVGRTGKPGACSKASSEALGSAHGWLFVPTGTSPPLYRDQKAGRAHAVLSTPGPDGPTRIVATWCSAQEGARRRRRADAVARAERRRPCADAPPAHRPWITATRSSQCSSTFPLVWGGPGDAILPLRRPRAEEQGSVSRVASSLAGWLKRQLGKKGSSHAPGCGHRSPRRRFQVAQTQRMSGRLGSRLRVWQCGRGCGNCRRAAAAAAHSTAACAKEEQPWRWGGLAGDADPLAEGRLAFQENTKGGPHPNYPRAKVFQVMA
eukprot:351259-Chlamydomonas_euryale.AAC.2